LALALFTGCAHKTQKKPPPTPQPEKEVHSVELEGRYYTVKKGDTLFSIAHREGIATEELVEINGLPSADQLAVGQILFLPKSDPLALTARKRAAPPLPAPLQSPDVGELGLAWPVKAGVVFREFSTDERDLHEGISIGAPEDTPVFSAGSGRVLYVGDEGTDFGLLVIVQHSDDVVTVYGHLARAAVKKGQNLKRGEPLGWVGTTGWAESPQVHFQVRKDRRPLDPLTILPGA
jgi:murein DD-endopeptidase MepM/ murein hydrolase activator NlpD